MNKQKVLEQLQAFDLTEVESKIYLFLLQNGPKTPLELSREADIERSKVYRYAKKLSDKKLLQSSNTARGGKLKAADAKNLQLLTDEKEAEVASQKAILPDLLGDLSKMSNYVDNEFEVKHYRGKEGLKQMFWNQLATKKEIIGFGTENRNTFVGKTFADKVRREQIRRKVVYYEIQNIDQDDKGNYWYSDLSDDGGFYKARSLDRDILDIRQYVTIFDNTISIFNSSKGEPVGVEITNSYLAKLQRQMFWHFWEIAGGKN